MTYQAEQDQISAIAARQTARMAVLADRWGLKDAADLEAPTVQNMARRRLARMAYLASLN